MSPGAEHWFDRVAAPYTRRQGLKAALAGMALTLPFARTPGARAANPGGNDDPHACQRGCNYQAKRRFERRVAKCESAASRDWVLGVVSMYVFGQIHAVNVGQVGAAAERSRCFDAALLRGKAEAYDCLQPNCPGFDPYAPGGPCEGCDKAHGCACCPSSESVTGYIPCHVPTDDASYYFCGCKPGGGCNYCDK